MLVRYKTQTQSEQRLNLQSSILHASIGSAFSEPASLTTSAFRTLKGHNLTKSAHWPQASFNQVKASWPDLLARFPVAAIRLGNKGP